MTLSNENLGFKPDLSLIDGIKDYDKFLRENEE